VSFWRVVEFGDESISPHRAPDQILNLDRGVLMKRLGTLIVVITWIIIISVSFTLPSCSQVSPSATGGGFGQIRLFGEFTASRPNYGTDFLLGPTFGGDVQFNRWIAGEARGSLLRWGPSRYHQDFALFGPRLQYPIGRLVPYGAFDLGIGHAVYPAVNGLPTLTSSNGFAWEIIGGADYKLNHRWSLRLGEFTYGSIHVIGGLNPWSFSSGVVFRLF
jgi:hypothetical protein